MTAYSPGLFNQVHLFTGVSDFKGGLDSGDTTPDYKRCVIDRISTRYGSERKRNSHGGTGHYGFGAVHCIFTSGSMLLERCKAYLICVAARHRHRFGKNRFKITWHIPCNNNPFQVV